MTQEGTNSDGTDKTNNKCGVAILLIHLCDIMGEIIIL